jgi:hypothetical protein
MGKKKQIEKNFDLSEKLANFFANNPKSLKKDTNYVVFSATDKNLNRANSTLVKDLKKKGKKVTKAKETRSQNKPWVFASP